MPTIREVKNELRHREWAEQIQESDACSSFMGQNTFGRTAWQHHAVECCTA